MNKYVVNTIFYKDIVNKYEKGMSLRFIGYLYRSTPKTIRKILQKNDIDIRKPTGFKKARKYINEFSDMVLDDYRCGYSTRELANKYNFSMDSVRRVLKKCGEELSNNNKNLEVINDKDKIIKLYYDGKSPNEIAKIYNVGCSTISRFLINNKVKMRTMKEGRRLACANHKEINDKDIDKINGWLLGDGCIETTITQQASFRLSSKYYEYANYVKQFFEENGINCGICRIKREEKYYWDIRTERTLQFKDIYNEWYPAGTKIVPDIKLTHNTMKNWIMDDGSVDKGQGNMFLHTCSFSYNDIYILIEKIKKFINSCGYKLSGFKVGISIIEKKDGTKYPSIYINRQDTEKIFDIIGKLPVKCFEYKFNRGSGRNLYAPIYKEQLDNKYLCYSENSCVLERRKEC